MFDWNVIFGMTTKCRETNTMEVLFIYIVIENVVKIVLKILISLDGSVRLRVPKRYFYSEYLLLWTTYTLNIFLISDGQYGQINIYILSS